MIVETPAGEDAIGQEDFQEYLARQSRFYEVLITTTAEALGAQAEGDGHTVTLALRKIGAMAGHKLAMARLSEISDPSRSADLAAVNGIFQSEEPTLRAFHEACQKADAVEGMNPVTREYLAALHFLISYDLLHLEGA